MKLKESLWALGRIKNKKLVHIIACFDKYLYAEMYAEKCKLKKDEFVIEKLPYLEPIDKDYY